MTPAASDRPLARKRILVVEDRFLIADELLRVLDGYGAQVVGPAATEASALELLQRQEIDLAVIDIDLRGRCSYDLARELLRRGIPYVFATGYESMSIPAEFSRVPHLGKPVNEVALCRALLELS